jgi:hypothetical protein
MSVLMNVILILRKIFQKYEYLILKTHLDVLEQFYFLQAILNKYLQFIHLRELMLLFINPHQAFLVIQI